MIKMLITLYYAESARSYADFVVDLPYLHGAGVADAIKQHFKNNLIEINGIPTKLELLCHYVLMRETEYPDVTQGYENVKFGNERIVGTDVEMRIVSYE